MYGENEGREGSQQIQPTEVERLDNEERLPSDSGDNDPVDDSSSDDNLTGTASNSSDSFTGPLLSVAMSEYSSYLYNSLNKALDSTQLDKSLALEAKMSGTLNNENQKIIEKQEEVIEKLTKVKALYEEFFNPRYNSATKKMSRIDTLKHDIATLEKRIRLLKEGKSKSGPSLLGLRSKKDSTPLPKRYPVEYNKARDKIVERLIDDQDLPQ
ncbi:Piso0_004826 [Millerozyma farinosa CBS 7064]|uniref:Biogenesis of lysosome-related organelles complex 1 subunit KXD1 n=1 Tax=Pichia sorbitophila (strain ATCC MYA-4447 / BCRC 22081 / CBS 7064 / NBRC 10061 / NRRL Y-12695) TaxID=559304 RepID=G8Y3H6_PICSO|nr:Piso0_004826 [Millerozyma farinosa CBS 7064]